ncbi:MAG: hypothetical protein U0Q16_29745 [Bryobacteraceae bacterium]
MHYLDWLERAVGPKLAEGSIGRLVFARIDLELTADHGLLGTLVAAGAESVTRWLAASPRSVYAQGGARMGFTSALIEFANGATALVSASLAHDEPAARVLVVGQQGTLRYDDFPEPAQMADPPAPGVAWTGWIEQSLTAGKAVAAARQ